MDKVGEKRRRKVKGGRAAAKDAAAKSDGCQKLLTQYKVLVESNTLN